MRKEYISKSVEDTNKIALEFSKTIKEGSLIFAKGELGAGKTSFFKALGSALSVNTIINSPTFNLIKIYNGKLNGKKLVLYHVDCYRLENAIESRKDLGLDEVIGEDNTLVYVEWPQYGDEFLRSYTPRIEIEIEYISENERRIIIDEK